MPAVETLTLNPSVDLLGETEAVVPRHKLRTQVIQVEPGGGGINVARALLNLGECAQAVFPAGGSSGEEFVRLLEEEGIDSRAIPVSGETRYSIAVRERSTGDQYRFVGSGDPLREAEWRACLEALVEPPTTDFVVLSGSFPPGVPHKFTSELSARLREVNSRLIVDTSGDHLFAAVDAGVFLLKPNRKELAALVGFEGDPANLDYAEAAREVVGRGVEALVVSLDADGAFFTTQSGEEGLVPSPEIDVVSTIGAGDSTVAGMVVGLVRGYSVLDAVRFGVAAGAATCLRAGSALCTSEDTERIFQRIPAPA